MGAAEVVGRCSKTFFEFLMKITAVFISYSVYNISDRKLGSSQQGASGLKAGGCEQLFEGNTEIFAGDTAEV